MLGPIQNIDGLHQLQILPLVLSPELKFDTPMHAGEAVCLEESGTWSVRYREVKTREICCPPLQTLIREV